MKSLLESSCLIFLLLFTNTPPSCASNANRKNLFALRGKKIKLSPVNERNSSQYFLWYKGGQAIANNRADNDVLVIEHVDFYESGVYEYKSLHAKDDDRPYSINLEVLSPPFFTLEPKNVTTVEHKTIVLLEVKNDTKITDAPEDLEIIAGETARFRCHAEADSTLPLRINWLRNNQSIDIEEEPRIIQHADNTLMIVKANSLDSGTYTCVASTDLDEFRAQATLLVYGEPKPPTLCSVTCGSKEAYVLWTSANDSWSPILRYSVQYNTTFTPEVWETVKDDVPASNHSYKVELSPWVNYTFRVIAWNEHGPSEPSSPSSVCTTPPDTIPEKSPHNLEAEGDEPRSLLIKWTAMPPIEHNAPNFMYRVYYKRDIFGDTWTIEDIHDWRMNQLRLDNLPAYQRYKIMVIAENEIGNSRWLPQQVESYSGEDVPLQAPGNFAFEMTSSTSALLSWNKVPKETVRGELRGYKIQYSNEKYGYSSNIMTIEPNKTQALIDGLTDRKYYVSIMVFNGRYHGPTSDIIIET